MSVFVDTSAFLAIIDADDEMHGPAAQTWELLIQREETLICTSYILVETLALIQHRLGLDALKQFREQGFDVIS